MADSYINLGEGKWRGRWISKQYLVEYIRCEYRVYLSFTKDIPISEMKETYLLQNILVKGLELESEVVQNIKPIEIETKESIEPLKKQSLIIQVPKIFRNHDLGIQGIPDLIDTHNGGFIPIEIKDHKEVTYTDELELAFYWLLLNPLRKKRVKPRGYIVLSNDEVAEVKITDDHFLDVESILDELRKLIKTGAKPSLSQECKLCKMAKDCRQEVVQSGGLTIIYNISYRREKQFQAIGVHNISELMRVDEDWLNSELIYRFGNTPGFKEIFRMKCHAFSLSSSKPVFYGDENVFKSLLSSPLLVLDLEYDPVSFIWLIGLCIKTGNRKTYKQYFAEKANRVEEKRLLGSLLEIKLKFPDYLLVTYGGIWADIPQLEKACIRNNFPDDFISKITENHLDLYYLLQNNFRFPMPSLGLDDIEEYLDIEKNCRISNGLEALAEYNRFLRTKDNELKQELLDYNKGDIISTLSIINKVPKLIADSLIV